MQPTQIIKNGIALVLLVVVFFFCHVYYLPKINETETDIVSLKTKRKNSAATLFIKSAEHLPKTNEPQTDVVLHKTTTETKIPVVAFFIKSDQYNNIGPISFPTQLCKYAENEKSADVVYANIFKSRVHKHFDKQIWVGTFWESEKNYKQLDKSFDYYESYRTDADFPNYAMMYDTFRNFDKNKIPLSFEKKKKKSMMSVWISNCGPQQRMTLLTHLADNGVSFDSYGKCKHTVSTYSKTLYDTAWSNFREKKLSHGSQYLFMYAAENSISPYYVTEKVFHGLVAGSVPVYFGTRDVFDFVPDNSIIFAQDYTNLHTYLHTLAQNQTAYNSYLEWRHKPLPARITKKMDLARQWSNSTWRKCHVCMFMRKKLKLSSENI